MAENKLDLELTGLERFSHLEDKIFRVVEAFKAIRKENDTLKSENQKLKGEVEQLQARWAEVGMNVANLEQERAELRERVERVLTLLASLETH